MPHRWPHAVRSWPAFPLIASATPGLLGCRVRVPSCAAAHPWAVARAMAEAVPGAALAGVRRQARWARAWAEWRLLLGGVPHPQREPQHAPVPEWDICDAYEPLPIVQAVGWNGDVLASPREQKRGFVKEAGVGRELLAALLT